MNRLLRTGVRLPGISPRRIVRHTRAMSMDAAKIECVMNVSEGRNADVIERISEPISAARDCLLLDVSSDSDHNRSVLTFVGSSGNSLSEAAFGAIARAVELIDLRKHRGVHPRIGAADVVPFVPLGDTTFETCVSLARELGRRVAAELKVPVYLYERAAILPDRRNLADVRRGGFERLRKEIREDPSRRPDFGDPELHPSAGATAIGVRDFLIAFNVYLDTPDLWIAREIAHRIRERDGGLPGVKALGLFIQKLHRTQVSVNLTDFRATSLCTVFDAISRHAGNLGAEVFGSEIVGLVPREAFPPGAESRLSLVNDPRRIILEDQLPGARP